MELKHERIIAIVLLAVCLALSIVAMVFNSSPFIGKAPFAAGIALFGLVVAISRKE